MIQIIDIRCEQCGRTVDRAGGSYDPSSQTYRFAVHCHGARDTCVITPDFLIAAGAETRNHTLRGTAFKTKLFAPSIAPDVIAPATKGGEHG